MNILLCVIQRILAATRHMGKSKFYLALEYWKSQNRSTIDNLLESVIIWKRIYFVACYSYLSMDFVLFDNNFKVCISNTDANTQNVLRAEWHAKCQQRNKGKIHCEIINWKSLSAVTRRVLNVNDSIINNGHWESSARSKEKCSSNSCFLISRTVERRFLCQS